MSVSVHITKNILKVRLSSFTFTGKELDEETGYSYFGARYYAPTTLAAWLSVDPMSDKYPSISPYAYCAWNPLRLVDPAGKDIWTLDNQGKLVDHIETDSFDQIHIVDNNNIVASSVEFEYGTISEICLDGQSNTSFSVCGNENAQCLFEFFADNYAKESGRCLEWGHAMIVGAGDEFNIVGTTHSESTIGLLTMLTDNDYSVSEYSHNHPSGNPQPSGGVGKSGKDLGNAKDHEKNHPGIKLYTYTPSTGYSRYNGMGCQDDRCINNWKNATWQEKK